MAISINALNRSMRMGVLADVHMPGMFTIEQVPAGAAYSLPLPNRFGPICEPCWLKHKKVLPADDCQCGGGVS